MTVESADDTQHLQLLSVFHYVVAAIQALFACLPLLHFGFGALMFFVPEKLGHGRDAGPPAFIGLFVMLLAGAAIAFGIALAVGTFIAGRSLAERKSHLFCLVMAGVNAAICTPFGTVLGIFTIIVLLRPSVKQAFGVVASPSR
jgi:hypothetical protein